MADIFYSIDKSLFYFCNRTLANPVFDAIMPILTDLNKTWYGLSLFGALWFLLMWKGGRKGRVIGVLLIPLIVVSDGLSSGVIKKLFARPRPCHIIDGLPVLDNIRLLVQCGSGLSFPSSHAVNNFAVATFLSYYYRAWTWAFMSFATIIGFSRVSVGVHYPSDVLGGAMFGALFAWILIMLWISLRKNIPLLDFSEPQTKTT